MSLLTSRSTWYNNCAFYVNQSVVFNLQGLRVLCVSLAFTPLLQHLPGRLKIQSTEEAEAEAAATLPERLSLVASLPLCLLSADNLERQVGSGTYGEVFPISRHAVEEGSCREIVAAASAFEPEPTHTAANPPEEAVKRKYGVKIFSVAEEDPIIHAAIGGFEHPAEKLKSIQAHLR